MDILGMLVRQDRVKALLEKKKVEWTEEEKMKESGGPITFDISDDEDDFLDMIFDMSEEETEEEDEDDSKDDDSLPCIDFIYKPQTIEEKVQHRLDEYGRILYHMKEIPFVKLCIKEGVLDENHIY